MIRQGKKKSGSKEFTKYIFLLSFTNIYYFCPDFPGRETASLYNRKITRTKVHFKH